MAKTGGQHATPTSSGDKRNRRSAAEVEILKRRAYEALKAGGKSNKQVAAEVGVTAVQISKWKSEWPEWGDDAKKQRAFRFSEKLDAKLEAAKASNPEKSLTEIVETVLLARFDEQVAFTKKTEAHQTVFEWLRQARLAEDGVSPGEVSVIFDKLSEKLHPVSAESAADECVKLAVYDAVLSLWRTPMDFVENWKRDRQFIEFPYVFKPEEGRHGPGNFPEVERFQEAILEKVQLFDDAVPLDVVFQGTDRKRTVFYDLAMRADITLRPRIFCFGFYLTDKRRSNFGIIRYGSNEHFGVLLTVPTWERFASTQPEIAMAMGPGKRPSPELVKKFFVRLIDYISKRDEAYNNRPDPEKKSKLPPRIYSLDGFIHDEIVSEVIYRKCPPECVDQFRALVTTINPSMDKFADAVRKEYVPKTTDGDAVFIVDLLCTDWVKKDDPDYKLIKVPHNLSIPVGIGFTLTALPRMLMQNEHERLLDALRNYFEDKPRLDALKIDFERTGVVLDPRFVLGENSNES